MKEIKPVRTHCLSNDELEKLLYHPDSIENQSILLDHISGCELCSDAYDGMKTLNEEGLTIVLSGYPRDGVSKGKKENKTRK